MRNQLRSLLSSSPALTSTSLLMLAVFLLTLPAIWLDPRLITGAPAWLKPAKFAISTAIFSGSMAWIFRYIHIWPRAIRATGISLSAILLLENAIIYLQAARGIPSHFNISTSLDASLWIAMGSAIGILVVLTALVAFALFRQPFENRAWGWTLRLAMLITLLGSSTGSLMTGPTPPQSAQIAQHQRPAAVGAHTVGAPDGGPGLPAVGWSRDHGDLRIPHFFGLHALQILPLFCWLFARRNTPLVIATSASYFALLAILVWQALRGQSILAPDAATLTALSAWLFATALATAASLTQRRRVFAQAL